MNEVIVITGGSSGIGLATAAALRKRNCRVYELSRRNVKHENGVLHLSADVTDEAAVKVAIDTVIAREGRVDVLICNAGFGISGAAEFTENEAAKHLLDVNLFGAVNAVKAVLPRMRAQHSGRILCICSIAAPVPIPFQAWYSVSKAAVRAYASALRGRFLPSESRLRPSFRGTSVPALPEAGRSPAPEMMFIWEEFPVLWRLWSMMNGRA